MKNTSFKVRIDFDDSTENGKENTITTVLTEWSL